jgi:UDP:flavonoid glycosyltransferase YjiC (YdhE family)
MVIGLGALAEKAQLSIDDERVLVLENAPQLEAIKHSELVICHGGCQTVHEALYFGKPLIGIPHHAEISEMVNSVEINGAGVRVAPSKISRGTLGEAIETATSEDTRGHAARLAAALGHADGQRNILALFARIESRISHT